MNKIFQFLIVSILLLLPLGHLSAEPSTRDILSQVDPYKPVILVFTIESCIYCQIFKENYYLAIQEDDRVTILLVDMDVNEEISEEQGIQVTPTIIFLDPQNGRWLAPAIQGLPKEYAFWPLMERSIQHAVQKFKINHGVKTL